MDFIMILKECSPILISLHRASSIFYRCDLTASSSAIRASLKQLGVSCTTLPSSVREKKNFLSTSITRLSIAFFARSSCFAFLCAFCCFAYFSLMFGSYLCASSVSAENKRRITYKKHTDKSQIHRKSDQVPSNVYGCCCRWCCLQHENPAKNLNEKITM